jgi:hypothetical protein
MPRRSIRTLDFYSGLFLLMFAVFITVESCRLGLGSWNNPGTGYFTFGASIILELMSLKVIAKGLRGQSEEENEFSDSEPLRWHNVVFILAGTVVYAFIFEWLGFIPSTFLLIIYLLRVISTKRWFLTLLTALSCAAGAYILFDWLLGAELPKGFLGL